LSAFEELVYRYEGRIYRFIRNFCRNETDAREVTQDTFVRPCQAIQQFDARRTFAPWLFTIARRKWIDHYRSARPVAEEPVPEQVETDDPAELLARREDGQDLWRRARACLPETQFQALWLRYAEDLSVAAAAQVLRKTQTHVKVLLFRARQTLARELDGAGQLSLAPPITVEAPARLSPAPAGQASRRPVCTPAPLKPSGLSMV
jgi:RNA polymerase sigma-70 factor (ECF subfamily)